MSSEVQKEGLLDSIQDSNGKPTAHAHSESTVSSADANTISVGQFLEKEYPSRIAEVDRLCAVLDPEKTPYKSKYEARDILKTVESSLKTYENSPSAPDTLVTTIALVQLRLGLIDLDTEETYHGERHLLDAWRVLEPHWPHNPVQTLECLNHLGILWNDRADYTKAKEFLVKAEELYNSLPQGQVPSDVDTGSSSAGGVEAQHTKTLFYLAQVYGHSKEVAKSAQYCLLTLQRQLQSSQYDALEWSKHALSIALYYTLEDMLSHAKQCLHAAVVIVPDLPPSVDKDAADSPNGAHVANLLIGWGKLFLQLLTEGAERHKRLQQGVLKGGVRSKEDEHTVLFGKLPSTSPAFLPFDLNTVHVAPVTSYDEARVAFLHGLECFNKAKQYYVLDGFVTDHFSILQEMSALYGELLAFEADASRRAKMFRRRIDLIEPLAGQLNPQHYTAMLQQIHYSLGELYHELYDIKAEAKENDPSTVKKTNALITKSTQYFQRFIESFERPRDKAKPNVSAGIEIDQDNMGAYVLARLSMAKLYGKVVASQAAVTCRFLQAALEQYRWIAEYAKAHPGTVDETHAEIASQMAQMLPLKIGALTHQATM